MGVRAGFQQLVVAGGVESMSRPAPMHVDGFTANNAHLREQYDLVPQGISADLIATKEGFTREECDQLGVDSQNRAAAAIKEGRFDQALVPIRHDDGSVALDRDEFPRPGTTMESLATLTPSFEAMGAHKPDGAARTIDENGAARLSRGVQHQSRPSRWKLVGCRRRRLRGSRCVARVCEGARHEAPGRAS